MAIVKTIDIKSAWQGNSDCNTCSIRSSVLFAELNEDDFSKIHSPIDDLRFEANSESEIYRFTPDLGLHRAAIDSLGSILITENQVRSALENFDSEGIREVLNRALGHDWELELEPYRGVDLQEISHLRAI